MQRGFRRRISVLMVVGAAVLTAARFIVTGIILLGAVTLDTLSRRRLAESGR